ncbi:hypothetical protein SAMN04487768_0762 [Burkholderia sp. b13]|nr:hypothetical protein SAMN04487768_0762 [Burkholderia sp. b13]
MCLALPEKCAAVLIEDGRSHDRNKRRLNRLRAQEAQARCNRRQAQPEQQVAEQHPANITHDAKVHIARIVRLRQQVRTVQRLTKRARFLYFYK